MTSPEPQRALRFSARTTDTGSEVTTRLAVGDDLDVLAILFDAYRQFYDQAPDVERARTWLSQRLAQKESVVIVAQIGDDIVGFCQMYPSFCSVSAAPIFVLYDLFVRPDARRFGVGRTLLLAAEMQAGTCGAHRMDLTTARTNRQAQALYESLGWTRDDVFLAYNKVLATPS